MKIEVKLYVGGKVFSEIVEAVNYQDARQTALARNQKARPGGICINLTFTRFHLMEKTKKF